MGQKVHPFVMRIGLGKTWNSRWFAERKHDVALFIEEDKKIRTIIGKSYQAGTVSNVQIERVSPTKIRVKIATSRPGVIIGRRGQDIENVKNGIQKFSGKEVGIDVIEIAQPAMDAQLVAEQIGFQLLKRINHKRAMKKAIFQAQQEGCEGIKIRCSGRLGGAELARREGYKEGKVPLHTLQSDIDFGFYQAQAPYGTIGIRVWIYKGEARKGSYMKTLDQAGEKTEKVERNDRGGDRPRQPRTQQKANA